MDGRMSALITRKWETNQKTDHCNAAKLLSPGSLKGRGQLGEGVRSSGNKRRLGPSGTHHTYARTRAWLVRCDGGEISTKDPPRVFNEHYHHEDVC